MCQHIISQHLGTFHIYKFTIQDHFKRDPQIVVTMNRAAALPLREPNHQYQSDYLDAYYDQDRHDKALKPKHDLVVRGLFRPHEDAEADMSSLPLLRYVFFHFVFRSTSTLEPTKRKPTAVSAISTRSC